MSNAINNGFDEPARSSNSADPHGQAAMVLLETLIHAMIANGNLTTIEAIEIVLDAAEVQAEIDMDRGYVEENQQQAVALLRSLSISLSHDLPET